MKSRANKSRNDPEARRVRFAIVAAVLTLTSIGTLLLFSERKGGSLKFQTNLVTEDPAVADQKIFSSYGGSASCRSCHEEEYEAWWTSNHGQAERIVRAETDQRAFNPARSFAHATQRSDLRWTNGAAEAIVAGLSNKPEPHRIARVIGNDPLRQFLVPFPGGRFQVLEATYDPHSNDWFNVYGNEDRKPGEWGHWTGRGMNWNFMCANCHNTRLRRHYDESSDTYRTTMAEMSVGCEACHGPLEAHNEWQQQYGRSGQKDPTLPKFSGDQTLDYCGSCHARRTELTGDFKPGDSFLDHFEPVIVDRSMAYHADGQVREEDYEYGSFLGSRMHLRNVRCVDCHNAHSAKVRLQGNWLCMRCHDGANTNAPVINPVSHSRHQVFGFNAEGTMTNSDLTGYDPKRIRQTGGECVNCHMPQTVYMQRHSRHDHGFTSPDPLLTKQFGIPNACNRCHQDKDVDWALTNCAQWYGAKMERPARQRAIVVAQAVRGDADSRDAVFALLDREESPYWRAVELRLLEPWADEPKIAAALLSGLENSNALVRTVAAHSLRSAGIASPPVSRALQRRLGDPVRSVRLAAAWSLRATIDPNSPAGRELQTLLDVNADQPLGQMQKGAYFFSRNDFAAALRHFQKAIAWDPGSPPFRWQLAITFSSMNRHREAVETLEEVCRLWPRDAESHYQLGLAYNETGDLKRVTDQLALAVQFDHRHARAWYNLGLAQNSAGESSAAIGSLLRAESVEPDDARIPYARATILARLGRRDEALRAVRRVLEIDRGNPEAMQLLQFLSQ